MSKHKQALSVPPKYPKLFDTWTREDGQAFVFNDMGQWMKIHEA